METLKLEFCYKNYTDGLVQERHNSSALAMELRLSCTNPLILSCWRDMVSAISQFKGWYIAKLNTLRLKQNGRHFADNIFECIFMNENLWISLKTSLKFVPKVRINNIPTLVPIMAWHLVGAKPLSEPMMFNLLTHICITRPQWVNTWVSWKSGCDFEKVILFYLSLYSDLVIMSSDECHCNALLMISQHWFRYWLGAIRHHAITWASVSPVICCHMATLGYNKLNIAVLHQRGT